MARGRRRGPAAQLEDIVATREGGPGNLTEAPQPRPKKDKATKAANFAKLSHDRISKVDEALYQLRQLCNREEYEYTAEDAKIIVAFLLARVRAIEESFCTGKKLSPVHLPSVRADDSAAFDAAAAKFGYTPPDNVDIELAAVGGNIEFGNWPDIESGK